MEYFGYKDPQSCVYARESLSLDKLKNGYLYMKEILETHAREQLPDVWIATSDYLAIGLMRAIKEKGYSIPGDFGVVGYDNLELSEYVCPTLTTVEQDQSFSARNCGNNRELQSYETGAGNPASPETYTQGVLLSLLRNLK